MAGKLLNLRERRFVDAYCGSAGGNATKAAADAGYSKRTARQQGSRLLTKAAIKAAVARRQARREQVTELSAVERDRILADIATDRGQDVFARIRSVSELNKVTGRHSLTHLHKGKLTLEQVLGQSRRLDGAEAGS